jgi:ABC-type bacteriocin/lantibiotic exporter with double-glycine peptidase domain
MPETSFEKPFRRLFQLLKLDSRDIFYLLAYAFFGGIISLTLPLGVQAIINLLATGQTSTSWVVLTVIISLATVLVGLLKISQLNITETLQQRIFTRAAFEFAYRIPRFKIEHLDDNYPPELANRFFDTLVVQNFRADFARLVSPFFLSFWGGFALRFGFGLVINRTHRFKNQPHRI